MSNRTLQQRGASSSATGRLAKNPASNLSRSAPIKATGTVATKAKVATKKSEQRISVQQKPQQQKQRMAMKNTFGGLDKALLLNIHDLMTKSRILEERLIRIYRAGESYFWIGGPGEEGWGVPLGLLVNKGQGLAHDYLHLHYRCTPTLVAMGMEMMDAVRLMMNRATDPSTGGRNFSGHYAFPKWNVAPVTSPIEIQYPVACGTAHAQKRAGHGSLSVVSGGDAGTAEGDFATCLIWASRKGKELPLLITVQNNLWGISTSYDGQHGEAEIADRAKAFGMRSRVVNGNDPVESYLVLQEEMAYIRKTGKPSFIEAKVSRLHGHSSATGANYVSHEEDGLVEFEKALIEAGILSEKRRDELRSKYEEEGVQCANLARMEPAPTAESVWDHVYFNNENADWRKF